MRLLLSALLALWLLPAAAQEQKGPPIDWQAHCSLPDGQTFGVRFHTDSPDVTDDNMQVTLSLPGGKQAKLALPPAWYHSVTVTGDVDNRCDGIVATSAGNGRVLLWLAPDNRPDFPRLTLALVDLSNGRVLAQRVNVGAIKDTGEGDAAHLVVRRQGADLEVRIVRDVLTKTNDDSAYNYIEDWLRVRITPQGIDTAWR